MMCFRHKASRYRVPKFPVRKIYDPLDHGKEQYRQLRGVMIYSYHSFTDEQIAMDLFTSYLHKTNLMYFYRNVLRRI